MSAALNVFGYAVAGLRACAVPAPRTVAFPAPGLHARQPRLPSVMVALARQALPAASTTAEISVFFGTALGCLTETQAFLEHMIIAREATPMPRAFSGSVHNAIASQVAIALKAHGESHTFVHADVAFLQALFAAARRRGRDARGRVLVGGGDEFTPHTGEARAACGWRKEHETAEGGAVLACGECTGEVPVLARLRGVAVARPRDALAWSAEHLGGTRVDALLMSFPAGSPAREELHVRGTRVIDSREFTGDHPASVAAAAAIAVAALCGELDHAALSLARAPSAIAIAAASRFGDAGLAVLERAP